MLPVSLWRDGRLHLPARIIEELRRIFDANALWHLAELRGKPDGVSGGASKQETDEYIARLGPVATARPMSVYLDPEHHHDDCSGILHAALARGKVAIIDVPAGCGHTTLGLLCSEAEIRLAGDVATFDTQVHILGLDISQHALQYFQDALTGCAPFLASQRIVAKLTTISVNIEDQDTVATTVNDWITAAESEVDTVIVLVSAFSGYAQGPKIVHVQEAFQYIRKRLLTSRDQHRSIVWLEPAWNSGKTLLDKLRSLLGFRGTHSESHYPYLHPFHLEPHLCNLMSNCATVCEFEAKLRADE